MLLKKQLKINVRIFYDIYLFTEYFMIFTYLHWRVLCVCRVLAQHKHHLPAQSVLFYSLITTLYYCCCYFYSELYHFIKLKFVKWYFEVNLSNSFPVNISGHTVLLLPKLFLVGDYPVCIYSTFVETSMAELMRFNTQKVSDFQSMLINYVQLQMHLHRQVGTQVNWSNSISDYT